MKVFSVIPAAKSEGNFQYLNNNIKSRGYGIGNVSTCGKMNLGGYGDFIESNIGYRDITVPLTIRPSLPSGSGK